MRIQVDRRIPATSHANGVTGQSALLAAGFARHHPAHRKATDHHAAPGSQGHKAAQDFNTGHFCGLPRTHINHRHLRTSFFEEHRIPIGTVVVGDQHQLLTHQHAIQLSVVGHRRRQHHTGQVVITKHHGALVRTCGQHHFVGPHTPQAFPETLAVIQGQMV